MILEENRVGTKSGAFSSINTRHTMLFLRIVLLSAFLRSVMLASDLERT